ncbi:FkbM family methyltransferase [Dankookia sp. GCM10030260]|uniref:FkbM family methyltransferase n=1 Tax=Dankookia sp. GCM10030260 TaxID=3273390 RepID=UPI0036179A0A
MPQGDSIKTPRRGGLGARLAGLMRPRPQARLLPLSRLAEGNRVATEAAIRALAGATPFAGNLLLCRALGRYKVFLDAADLSFAPHLAADGYWEWWTTRFLASTLRPGEQVIDVGAGIGYFTLLMADLVGPQGRVLALEPNPQAAALLRRNLQLNGFAGRSSVEEAAVAASGGRLLRLAVPPGSPLDAHLLPQDQDPATPRPGEAPGRLLVRGRRLDELDVGAVDFVRLDVGDALAAAWEGMQRLLAERPALRMLLGFEPHRMAQPAGFLDAVAARFALRRLLPDGTATACTAAELLGGGQATLFLAKAG